MYFVKLRTGAQYGPFATKEKAEAWRDAQAATGYDAKLFADAEIVKG